MTLRIFIDGKETDPHTLPSKNQYVLVDQQYLADEINLFFETKKEAKHDSE